MVELLVVIAIIGLLIALLLPAVQAVREAGRRATCANNIRQLGLGASVYHDAHQSFPPHFSPTSGTNTVTGVSWLSLILPQIEQQAIFNLVQTGSTTTSGSNLNLARNRIGTFLCPTASSDRSSTESIAGFGRAYTTHYVGNMGPLGTNPATGEEYPSNCPDGDNVHGRLACAGVLPLHPVVVSSNPTRAVAVRIRDITDGTAKTLLAFEASWKQLATNSYRAWIRGVRWNVDATAAKNVRNGMGITAYNGVNTSATFNNVSMGSDHPGGCQVVMADGSVRFLSEAVDLNLVLLPMASRAGSEVTTNE